GAPGLHDERAAGRESERRESPGGGPGLQLLRASDRQCGGRRVGGSCWTGFGGPAGRHDTRVSERCLPGDALSRDLPRILLRGVGETSSLRPPFFAFGETWPARAPAARTVESAISSCAARPLGARPRPLRRDFCLDHARAWA